MGAWMTGAYPGAHPTAPGGMSEAALAVELVEEHGWKLADAKALKWSAKIEAVAQARLAAEPEAAEPEAAEPEAADTDDTDDLWADLDDDDDGDDSEYLLVPNPADSAAEAVPEVEEQDVEDTDPEQIMAELQEEQAKAKAAEPPSLFIGMPGTHDYVFDGHAGTGPSASERWIECTASLGAVKRFLETLTRNQQATFAQANLAARQGTTAHAAGEVQARVLLGEVTPEEADATLMELAVIPDDVGESYDEEMAHHVGQYVDLVATYVNAGRDVRIESRVMAAVPLTDGHEGEVYTIPGSADLIVLPSEEEPTLVVGDLKYGSGIDVVVQENSQTRIYALGALALLVGEDGTLPEWLTTVEYHIFQPRLGGLKTWTESVDDLLDWRDAVLAPALTAALTGEGATFSPSDTACQWCPVRGSCAPLAAQRLEQAQDLFTVITEAEYADEPGAFPETTTLDNTRLASLLSQVEGLVKIHADLKAEAERRLYRGESLPGYQLVNYTPPRKWKEQAPESLDPANREEGMVTEEQAEALWKHSLLTPKQALEVLKLKGVDKPEQAIGDLIITPPKRPVVAKVGDRRKTWEGPAPEDLFPDLPETGATA